MTPVLVAYATRCGSTAEIAQRVGDTLRQAGAAVTVLPVKEVREVSSYRAVIVGSAIRMGRWLPEALEFLKVHRTELEQRPVAYLGVCMALSDPTEENLRTAEGYLDAAREVVEPVSGTLFAGAVDYRKLPFWLRPLAKLFQIAEGDFRDWDAIDAWAAQVYPALLET